MAKFKINKNKNYTTISNYHLKDTNLSLKAKGLLSLMLSLPNNWDYSVAGLTNICLESKNTINDILNELEKNNYLIRKRIYKDGKICEWEYNIYESKNLHPKNEDIENEDIENQDLENWDDNNILNNNEEKNIIINNNIPKEKFKKPTIEEIQEYCEERNNGINANYFYDFYESKGWYVGKNKVKDWKACVRTWERNQKKESPKPIKTIPEWFDKDIKTKETEIDEDFKNFIEEFRKN